MTGKLAATAKPRPVEFLHELVRAAQLHSLWPRLDAFRATHRGEWPDCIYCPSGKVLEASLPLETVFQLGMHRTAVLAAWRVTQGIYHFDETLLDELWNTPISGELPVDLLHRMPEWCVYVEIGRVAPMIRTRGGRAVYPSVDHLHGVFACLDIGVASKAMEIVMLLDYEMEMVAFGIPLQGTIDESVRAVEGHVRKGIADANARNLGNRSFPDGIDLDFTKARDLTSKILSLVLYLCSEEPDLRESEGSGRVPAIPAPVVTKKYGSRYHSPTKATYWNLGFRLGPALRKARDEAQLRHEEVPTADDAPENRRDAPLGHIRRAHWHTFWTGPRNQPEQRRRILKWLPPMAVNLDTHDELIATLRRVT